MRYLTFHTSWFPQNTTIREIIIWITIVYFKRKMVIGFAGPTAQNTARLPCVFYWQRGEFPSGDGEDFGCFISDFIHPVTLSLLIGISSVFHWEWIVKGGGAGGRKGASEDLNGALSSREAAEIMMVSVNRTSRHCACTTKTRLDFCDYVGQGDKLCTTIRNRTLIIHKRNK